MSAAPVLLINPWTEPDPVDLCLDLWHSWMACDSDSDSDRDLGAKTMRGLCREGDAHGIDLYEEAPHASDTRIAQTINAAIDSMPRLSMWLICRACPDRRLALLKRVTVGSGSRGPMELVVKLR